MSASYPNPLNDEVFLFGASCAPYAKGLDWPMEEWDRDLATMKRLNFNTVRIFAPWDRIEPVEGEFDFHKQDHLFDLAEKHGIGVVLNFGGLFWNLCGLYPPAYLLKDARCQTLMNTPEAPTHSITPQRIICSDDPVFRSHAFRFLEQTVRRYAGRESLAAWMIWNEPQSMFCYCPHTQVKFRRWLERKYGTIEKLKAVWSTEYPVTHTCWEDITAPAYACGLPIWFDWVRFNQFRLYDTMSEITQMVRRIDPSGRPTTSNFVYHMAATEGPLSTPRYGLDIGRAGEALTMMGVSCYTVEHLHDLGPGYLTAYKLSRLRSASQDVNRRMLVLETGVGPNKRMITRAQRLMTFWHLIAHNAKSIILWNYRSRAGDSQVALFHLMKWDGSPSSRAEYMGEFSGMLQANARLINTVYPERQAAILTLEDQQIQTEAICGDYYPYTYVEAHDSRVGAYKLLWDLQIPADCIAENNLDELPMYKLLLIPMAENLSPEVAGRIRQFVANGGTVIAESTFGLRDQDGRLQYRAPGFGLDEVFGCWTSDREGKETAPVIQCPDGQAKVCFFWSEFELAGGTPAARYADGKIAAVRHRHGKGSTLLVGTEVFRQYQRNPQQAMTRLLQGEVLASGAQPTATLTGQAEDVEVARLSGPGGILYLVINHAEESRRFRLHLRDEIAGCRLVDLQTEDERDLTEDLQLAGKEVLALRLEAAETRKPAPHAMAGAGVA
ncbi:beta-galactosidase [Terrimicrobium sacchariphilum]|uniref:beta-galactosidase n=1 Tax=Terrimicrobium sacchariphilum TaxID=690879 RepID=A0A146G562_TERSA|nr:beta-galactosidase [Terrimicrobium sacchariphilum]GAT32542.1 beta-galactosidase [Terrimicrobium sacchariphilum]